MRRAKVRREKCAEGKGEDGKCADGKCAEGKSEEGKCAEGEGEEGKCAEGVWKAKRRRKMWGGKKCVESEISKVTY